MRLLSLLAGLLLATVATACSASAESADEDVGSTEGASSLATADFVKRAAPAGMPTPWTQPASRGIADLQGMCGPTAISNMLLFHGIRYSPEAVYETGGVSMIGTTAESMEGYFHDSFPNLDCDFENPDDGIGYLRTQLRVKRPVNVLLGMDGLQAHWVVVVGMTDDVRPTMTVMSWGKYYDIAWKAFDDGWSKGWAGHNPAITCAATTKYRFAW